LYDVLKNTILPNNKINKGAKQKTAPSFIKEPVVVLTRIKIQTSEKNDPNTVNNELNAGCWFAIKRVFIILITNWRQK
jgi:hypothetical protein